MRYRLFRFAVYFLLFTAIAFSLQMTLYWLIRWITGDGLLHYINSTADSFVGSFWGSLVLMTCFAGSFGFFIALASLWSRWWSRYTWLQVGMAMGIVVGSLVVGIFAIGTISARESYLFWNPQADISDMAVIMVKTGFYFIDRGLWAFATAFPINFLIFAVATGLAWAALYFVERSERRFYPSSSIPTTDHFDKF